MALVKAFESVRPDKQYAHLVAALPYDVMNCEEAYKMAENNKYSFLHIDRAEIDLPQGVDLYDKKVYEKAKENLYSMISGGVFKKDNKPSLYIYRLIMNGRSQTGIVGCVSIDEYLNNTIKKHEYTKPDKEQDRINHVDICNANTGPIFLTYKKKDSINDIVKSCTYNEPEYDFVSSDGIRHTVWIIDSKKVAEIIENFKEVKSLYIADGHHRAASAVNVGLKRRKQYPDYTGNEEFNYFLAVMFPSDELNILDYNRVVKDLNGFNEEEFMNQIKSNFTVFKCNDKNPYRPEERHTFGMYLNDKWYKLIAKKGTFNEEDSIDSLDVSILQNNLITPVLGITDPKSDKRIDFVGGIRGLKELERRVHKDMKVAFSMYPTSMEEIIRVADEGKVMPAKSTWFEPKLRSGLFIHLL
ncbi:MAG: DUF1015 family protein [Inconstantimicrobium porci]|uniref:DUF1015 domain-containing protein n=1 Tax=Inconstantimicrobium porci TaxID=2652291 RepID=UPI002A910E88|nr:DUF1015 family protein [Inconstantimicrobium porci]MDY5912618.1 DUF1015 family protein [Inconstantimicrobium porci]